MNKTANLIRKEILSLLGDLPKIYDGLASDCKGLDPYIKMYAEFINKVHDLKSQNGEASSNILPDLSFLIERGNVTTYEWVHGEPPLSIIHPADLQMGKLTYFLPKYKMIFPQTLIKELCTIRTFYASTLRQSDIHSINTNLYRDYYQSNTI